MEEIWANEEKVIHQWLKKDSKIPVFKKKQKRRRKKINWSTTQNRCNYHLFIFFLFNSRLFFKFIELLSWEYVIKLRWTIIIWHLHWSLEIYGWYKDICRALIVQIVLTMRITFVISIKCMCGQSYFSIYSISKTIFILLSFFLQALRGEIYQAIYRLSFVRDENCNWLQRK